MNLALDQPHLGRPTARTRIVVAAVAVTVAIAAVGGYAGIRWLTSDRTPTPPALVQTTGAGDAAGLGAALAVQYAPDGVTRGDEGSGLGEALSVDWTTEPVYVVDTSLGAALAVQYPTGDTGVDTSLGDALAVQVPNGNANG